MWRLVLAYRLKKPANFVQHFLETCHSNRSRSAVHLHQYHMERPPPPKTNRKQSWGRKIDLLPLEKSLFFRRKNADFSARVARFFRKFWRSSGEKRRNLLLGFKASEKSEGTLPVQCDNSKAIESGRATPTDRQGRENAVFGNYLAGEVMPR